MKAHDLAELLRRRSSPGIVFDEPAVSAVGDALLEWMEREHAAAPVRLHRELFARLGCMSPEQARGRPCDVRSDVFSAGAALFLVACGRAPFDGIDELIAGNLHAPKAVKPELSDALAQVLSRALAVEPAQRFASAAELRAALTAAVAPAKPEVLEALLGAAPPLPEPVIASAPSLSAAKPSRSVGFGIAALLIAAVAGTFIVLRAQEQQQLDEQAAANASMRPCEIISMPAGAVLGIDGVPYKNRAPTVVRFEPGRTYTITLQSRAGLVTRQIRDQKKLVVRLNDGAVIENEIYGAEAPPSRKQQP